ncbi:MAG: Rieske 2Fe-2S domain-containing protein [Armatimonadota bacterium]|nr:Rieske 2Fe-2S domain-containing protein [Armatimonadota bacterium]MDR7564047.1 Rieske 2Fe-2S domain-containing protein [Armatimonadota bacterium]MDR7568444.1 Rieske 2Fe-2S domain-containing protein [Armatimonadota bacterium]MDR7601714.1 Rieske 2Fe-2S domain-containing protein [Armatimonadota bacterium]
MPDRRTFLRWLGTIPALGALAAFASPLLRYLKPNLDPGLGVLHGKLPHLTEGDLPKGEPLSVAALEELQQPWSSKFFVFTQKYPQYTPELAKAATVPGVAIKLPWKVRFPGYKGGEEPTDIVVFSRICPHLGCIFNYVPEWREVTAGYGGYVPPPERRHALLACPCHLSIFDPADRDLPGRVLSGPAPRPPRHFTYEIRDGVILVTAVEVGGIA